MTKSPTGIIPALITPFGKDYALNTKGLRDLIRFVLKAKVHGIFVSGNAGEFYALSFDEKKKIFEIAVEEVAGQIPVYAGTGAISTEETIRLTEMAASVGVDAASIITPFFISLKETEVLEHYRLIARKSRIPIVVYNNPALTKINVSVNLALELSKIDKIVGIKESSGDMTLTTEIIRNAGPAFAVLAGRDTLIYSTLTHGGSGAISSCANVTPEIAVRIYENYKKGDHENALKAQNEFAPLRIAFGLGSFPVVIKEALELLGIAAGPARLPIATLSEDKREQLRGVLKTMGVI